MLLAVPSEAPVRSIGHPGATGMTTMVPDTVSKLSWRGYARSEVNTQTRILGAAGSAKSKPTYQIGIEGYQRPNGSAFLDERCELRQCFTPADFTRRLIRSNSRRTFSMDDGGGPLTSTTPNSVHVSDGGRSDSERSFTIHGDRPTH